MKYIIKEYYYNIPDNELIKDLRRVARKLKSKWVACLKYDELGKFDSDTLIDRYGGWNAALLKAGLKIRYQREITRENLMRNLKNVWDKLGRQPKYLEMLKPLSQYSMTPYVRKYGVWSKALKAFSKWINKGKNKNKGEAVIIPRIRKRKRKRPHIPDGLRYKVFKRDKFKCVICGRSPATHPAITLHIDHIKPLSKGGTNTIENTQTACSNCNLGKATDY